MNNKMPRLSKVATAYALASSCASSAAQQGNGNSFGEVASFVDRHSKRCNGLCGLSRFFLLK
jgi:hypothetical protein